MSAITTALQAIVTSLVGMVSSWIGVLTAEGNEILLFFLLFSLGFAGIGIIRRLLRLR